MTMTIEKRQQLYPWLYRACAECGVVFDIAERSGGVTCSTACRAARRKRQNASYGRRQ